METNLIQITSACIVLASSLVPLNFMLGVKSHTERFLSTILFVVLLAYVTHSLMEAFDLVAIGYQAFAKICFVTAALGLVASYLVCQVKARHMLVGGLFGVAMLAAFGAWMAVEVIETSGLLVAQRLESVESLGSVFMAGFGVFLVARFFWLRHSVTISYNYAQS
jgi:hypothetical protein